MAIIPSLAFDFKMVCFPVKEEMEDPSKYTEANPVTLESTRQARKDGTTPQWDLTD